MTISELFPDDKLRFLESVLDAVPGGIVVLDRAGEITWVNPWIAGRYATSMPLVGKKYEALFPRDASLEDQGAVTLEPGRPHRQVVTYPSSEKPGDWIEFSMSRLEDAQGALKGAVVHVKDITQHKLTEQMLESEAMRRRLLVEQSRDGIVVLDQEGRVYEANQRYAEMLGYTIEEVHQLHVWDWDTQWSKEELLRMIEEVDETGSHFETHHRRKDGTTVEVEISTNGSMVGRRKLIFCVCRDITARVRAEQGREKLIEELQEALAEIKTLRGILPLCSYCKKIRNEKGEWERVDIYIREHSQAGISHGICPDCTSKFYSDLDI